MCVQLRCEGPLKLGTAFKALKRARRLLRHQGEGIGAGWEAG